MDSTSAGRAAASPPPAPPGGSTRRLRLLLGPWPGRGVGASQRLFILCQSPPADSPLPGAWRAGATLGRRRVEGCSAAPHGPRGGLPIATSRATPATLRCLSRQNGCVPAGQGSSAAAPGRGSTVHTDVSSSEAGRQIMAVAIPAGPPRARRARQALRGAGGSKFALAMPRVTSTSGRKVALKISAGSGRGGRTLRESYRVNEFPA